MFRVTFKVEGRGSFPTDMLRYDTCWPRSPRDVVRMDEIEHPRTIELAMNVQSAKRDLVKRIATGRVPTTERWLSFGWQVTDVRLITV